MNSRKLFQCVHLLLETTMSYRQVGAITGLAHNTVRRYKRMLDKKQLSWVDIQNMSADQLERLLSTCLGRYTNKRIPDWSYIQKEMQRRDVTRALLWEEYRLSCPDDALSMSRFNELYSEYLQRLDITMRQTHRAGERVFVDFAGRTVPWTDPETGEEQHAQIFVAALGCSNYTFAYAVPSQSIPGWIEAHNQMFRFFGGVPKFVIPDNLKAAITKAGRDPKINEIYEELAHHYRTYVLATRVRKPRDKAKVEVAVQIVQRWVLARLRNMKFFSIAEINAAIAALINQLNDRRFRRLETTRRALFEELDKPALKRLPDEPFEHVEWIGSIKVPSDYHIYVDKHYYSVPYQLAHERVQVKVRARTVEFYFNNKRVASHPRSSVAGGETQREEHFAPDHQTYLDKSPDRFLDWARAIGAAATAAVQHQFRNRDHVLISFQACNALQALAKQYGTERFETACRRAQEIGSLTVKSIRSILKRKLPELLEPQTPQQVGLPLHHHNVRGAAYYATGGR